MSAGLVGCYVPMYKIRRASALLYFMGLTVIVDVR
jgi:hypothetical protein